jgi:hypothetical protein
LYLGNILLSNITNSSFEGYSIPTENGGAIYSDQADHPNITINITNCNFNANTALQGGALYLNYLKSLITITNSTLSNNHALRSGGAIFYSSTNSNESSLTIDATSKIFSNMATNQGGGLDMPKKIATFSESSIFNNTADYGGNYSSYGTKLELRSKPYEEDVFKTSRRVLQEN